MPLETGRARPAEPASPATRPWALTAILLLSAAYLLVYSHSKALWGDEALTFYTIHHRTLLGLLRFQRTTPVVLEPPTNDILLWAVGGVLGYAKWALRLPSVLFFLLLQWLVYRLTALVAGDRAARIAVLALLATQFVSYGAEARPYALLTALTVAALVLWHSAHASLSHRQLALAGLALVIALAVTTQFYGVLLLLPLLTAEASLSLYTHRRPDPRALLAMGLGLAAAVLDLPFVHAVRQYQPPGLDRGRVGAKQFLLTYEWGFLKEPPPLHRLHVPYAVFIALALLLALAGTLPLRPGRLPGSAAWPLRRALWTALAALTLYPLPAILIGHFVTHLYYPRYGIQCIVGLVALLAIFLAQITAKLSAKWLWTSGVLGVAYLAAACTNLVQNQLSDRDDVHDAYILSDPVRAVLAQHPSAPVYLTIDECLLYPWFGDPALDGRLRCLYSLPLEKRYNHAIMSSRTAQALGWHTDMPLRIIPFEALPPGQPLLLAYDPRPWLDWIPLAIAARHGITQPLDTGFGGTVSLVTLPAAPSSAPGPRP